jgi:hypothetical protein
MQFNGFSALPKAGYLSVGKMQQQYAMLNAIEQLERDMRTGWKVAGIKTVRGASFKSK